MNIFKDLNQEKDELYDWKESMHRSRSLTCLDPKVDIITSIFLAEEIIHRILKQSTPAEVKDWNWLDPVAGRGTFGYVLFYVLYNYLKDEIKDKDERRKHILNHLYLAEINKGLYKNLKKDFIHVYHVDSLDFNFNNMKFDVVIGNPPYQRDSKSKGEPLWPKFSIIFDNMVKKGGYVGIIIPSSWMAAGFNGSSRKSVYNDVLKNKEIINVNIKSYIKEMFKVSSKFSYIIYRNSENTKNKRALFNTDDGDINISLLEYDFLPIKLSPISLSIIAKTMMTNNNFFIKMFHKALPKKSEERSETKNSTNAIKHWVVGGQKSNKIYYTYLSYDRTPDISSMKKVVFPIGGADKFTPYIDIEGIPVCQQGFYIPIDEDNVTVDSACSVFYSNLFKFLTSGIRTSGYFKINMLRNLPKISLAKSWTDQELYNYFNLTQEEIDYIEANI